MALAMRKPRVNGRPDSSRPVSRAYPRVADPTDEAVSWISRRLAWELALDELRRRRGQEDDCSPDSAPSRRAASSG